MSLRRNTHAVESLLYSWSIGQAPTFKARQFSVMSFWAPLCSFRRNSPIRLKNILKHS